jgi:uncharacterized iron-regulated protein
MRSSIFMMLAPLLLSGCVVSGPTSAPVISMEHYRVYRADGTASTLEILLEEALASQVLFIGESHNDPVAHHLQAEIYKALWRPELALSLEMFERDVQLVLDEYLSGLISDSHLLESSRAWSNYESDYKPLIDFARQQEGVVIAANAPRRYINLVGREGAEALMSLPEAALSFLAPLPYAEASMAYREKFMRLMQMPVMAAQQEHSGSEESIEENDSDQSEDLLGLERSLQAQSLWDATMAWSIAAYIEPRTQASVIHINGSFHSAEGIGIPEHLQNYLPGTRTLIVTIIDSYSFPNFEEEDMQNQGDFVIITDATLPRSF